MLTQVHTSSANSWTISEAEAGIVNVSEIVECLKCTSLRYRFFRSSSRQAPKTEVPIQEGMFAVRRHGDQGPCSFQQYGMLLHLEGQGKGKRHRRAIEEESATLPHVCNGSHACAAERFDSWAVILYNKASTTTHSQKTCQLHDHVFRSSPAAQSPLQFDPQDPRSFQFPGGIDHGVDGVCSANANGNGTQTACIRSVTVSPQHHKTRGCIVLQYCLMNDPRAGGQNSMPYFFAADSRKSKTSLLPSIDAGRSTSVPRSPTII